MYTWTHTYPQNTAENIQVVICNTPDWLPCVWWFAITDVINGAEYPYLHQV